MKPINLDKKINYIVSGLERSGTSLLMQILHAGGIPTSFSNSRPADENNPKGYYELEGGKIINKLLNRTFPIEKYKGKFIKITAFGLQYLPLGMYKIIYMERNLDEVLDSMEKMAGINDKNREKTKDSFQKLNEKVKQHIKRREDVDVLFINYNEILYNPKSNIEKLSNFLCLSSIDKQLIINAIDISLYRHRR